MTKLIFSYDSILTTTPDLKVHSSVKLPVLTSRQYRYDTGTSSVPGTGRQIFIFIFILSAFVLRLHGSSHHVNKLLFNSRTASVGCHVVSTYLQTVVKGLLSYCLQQQLREYTMLHLIFECLY